MSKTVSPGGLVAASGPRSRTDHGRRGWAILAAELVAATVVILWLDRGTTFNIDQMRLFMAAPGFDLGGLLEPQNGNLILTTNLAYKVSLELFGANFLPFRVIQVAALAIATVLLYMILKRRIGPIVALAPATILLFFGSDWGHIATSLGFTVIGSVAAGLGALVLLEREDRSGDLGACALLILSVASFSTGLAFLVGAAVSILLRSDRLARAWVYGLPLAIYFAWWLWARGGDAPSEDPQLSNLLLVPDFAFTSLSAVLASLTGLNYDFAAQNPPGIAPGPGPALAIAAIVALGIYLARGRVNSGVWVGLAMVLTFWALIALVSAPGFRDPTKTRYMYPAGVMVVLIATAAVSDTRPSRKTVIAIFAVATVALATNLMLMRNGAAWFRNAYSAPAKAQFTMLDLARGHVGPAYDPLLEVGGSVVSTPAGPYLAASESFGSPGFTLAELSRQPEAVRSFSDVVLADALALALEPVAGTDEAVACQVVASSGGSAVFELPREGATLELRSALPAVVRLRRFADTPTVDLGSIQPRIPLKLDPPMDTARTPWRVDLQTPGRVEICKLERGSGVA